ncbi:hypothetical protein E2C01_045634 [Portunus trituberculatus]|uniref:Uncharacterized protein n=1 Tax=Portunus trituberculatus TaxID=210409 RepID=A0A5B7FVN0_PORTR|nr:hypothetical protein [Portunus trituberculatus]
MSIKSFNHTQNSWLKIRPSTEGVMSSSFRFL